MHAVEALPHLVSCNPSLAMPFMSYILMKMICIVLELSSNSLWGPAAPSNCGAKGVQLRTTKQDSRARYQHI
jgi:hypothetical protein